MLNEIGINPAVAGKDNYADVRSNNRYQWMGITDAPRTYMLTLHSPLKNRHMGLGTHIYTDIVGPTRRVGISLAYAYHIKVAEKTHISLGYQRRDPSNGGIDATQTAFCMIPVMRIY